MRTKSAGAVLFLLAAAGSASPDEAATGGLFGWVHGDWHLIVGGTAMVGSDFEGGEDLVLGFSPIVSLGKAGPEARFVSRNDGISLSLFDDGALRTGLVGRIVVGRDEDDADELRAIDPVRWGGEAGGFVEAYPSDWLRLRAEVVQGFLSHEGVVADVAADAFWDVTPDIRVSGGPRLTAATEGYFDAWYGISPAEAAASGVSAYEPGSGLKSAGIGGAIDWKTTEKFTTSLFGEYERLLGPAAASSLVKEHGSENQFTFGVSAKYRFDFQM